MSTGDGGPGGGYGYGFVSHVSMSTSSDVGPAPRSRKSTEWLIDGRGILLACDKSLVDYLQEQPTRAPEFRVGARDLHVRNIDISFECGRIDVTKAGDAQLTYVAGPRRATFRISAFGVPDAGMFDQPLLIEEQFADYTVRASLQVTDVRGHMSAQELNVMDITAVAIGEVQVTRAGQVVPRDGEPEVLRAIRLT